MASASILTSDASRQELPSGALTPASDSSVNRSAHDGSSAAPRKRKREAPIVISPDKTMAQTSSHPMEDLLKPSILLKPHPPNVLAKSCSLLPLMLLPREQLALSCLDLTAPFGDLPAARFFESRIRVLDLEGRLSPSILIARSDQSEAVYAVERSGNGLYTVCRLGSWVRLNELSQCATVTCQQRIRPSDPATAEGSQAKLPLTTPHMYKENKKKRLAIEELQSMVRRRPRSETVLASTSQLETNIGEQGLVQLPTPESCDDRAQLPQSAQQAAAVQQTIPLDQTKANETTLHEQYTAQDIFENIRNQYLEALYHSMGSLAYFAKGPLSRARAAFHLDCDSNLEMRDLIEFLKSLVLTTVQVDRKFAETVPEILSQMKTVVDSSGNERTNPKRKKTKKMKLGKNGTWTGEDRHVRQWWTATRPEMPDHDVFSVPQETRLHIQCLRTRETQLQMIVILEILALEKMCPTGDAVESQLPGMEAITPIKGSDTTAKRRSKHNLPFLIDVHVDRLCISQSLALDDVKAIADSQLKSLDGQTGSRPSSDPLKDFCVDIILPFFAARLPDLCDTLNRKLGGPVIMSPPKPRLLKTLSAPEKARPRPGSVTKRPAPAKTTRNLDRVLSNERLRRSVSRGPTDAIAHMRSATVAPIPGLKREMSEPRLGGVQVLEPAQPREKPPTMLARSMSLTGADDIKARKRAMVDAELHNAISALKKPNRQLAGQAIVEETERRLFTTSGSRRKQRAPVRNTADRVVKATPVSNRFRDALAGDSSYGKTERPKVPAFDAVPSSSAAPRRRKTMFDSPTVNVTPTSSRVQATPLKAWITSSQPRKTDHEDMVPPSSPSMVRHSPVAARRASASLEVSKSPNFADMVPASSPLMAKKIAMPRSFTSQPAGGGAVSAPTERAVIEASPQKKPALAVEHSPAPASEQNLTIYQRLGWDEEDLDDLA